MEKMTKLSKEPGVKRLSGIRLKQIIKDRLQDIACKENRSFNNLANLALEEWIAQYDRKRQPGKGGNHATHTIT